MHERIIAGAGAVTLAGSLGLAACAGTAGPSPGAGNVTPASSAPRQAAQNGCATIQRDLTTAMNDLQVSGFSAWETSYSSGALVAGASMTTDVSQITRAYKVISSMMGSLSGSAADAVGNDLADTGGSFQNLMSGNGTVTDEAAIVHDLSAAVASAVNFCGPSRYTRYAPIQEQTLDDMAALPATAISDSDLAGVISQTRTLLSEEEALAAKGPQGNGGGCTISLQMANLAEEAGGSGNFQQDLSVATVVIQGYRQSITRLQNEIASLEGSGLAVPAGAGAALSASQSAVSQYVTGINQQIGSENSLLAQAYSMADAMAKIPATGAGSTGYSGSCEGNAPGKPPVIQDIS